MSEPMPSVETREEVMFFDTDCGGVVHNTAYLRMIETCRTRLAVSMGMDLASMAGKGEFPVVIRTEIDYIKPAKLADLLRIRGWIEDLARARFRCAFEVLRESDGAVLVRALQSCALVSMPAGKPLRLPADWVAKWGGRGVAS